MLYRTLQQHLDPGGPKRILALDGGGVRGILTLGYLARIEKILRLRSGGDPAFRLSDYFDLIGGTSTGSIIAAALTLGFTVEELRAIYISLAQEIFKKPIWRFGLYLSKFPDGPLRETLSKQFGADTTIGSHKIKTGLMMMAKRLDTGSPWVIHNNPSGKYYNKRDGGKGLANKDFLLTQVVRASTAAPHYFEPERIQVATAEDQVALEGAFVDGGVSPWNNPAFQLLMMATLSGFGLRWSLGADKLLLVSVGTGYSELRLSCDEICAMPASVVAMRALLSMMDDCDWLSQTILQWLSQTKTPWPIDREIGDLSHDLLGRVELLTYLRYNINLDSVWLAKTLQVFKPESQIEKLRAMDDWTSVTQLDELGHEVAEKQIDEDQLPAKFDL